MSTWKNRLERDLEPILALEDPRPKINAYHDMPYAIFRYSAEDELEVRKAIGMLGTRLEQRGKRITTISLAKCLATALERAGMTPKRIEKAEKMTGVEKMIDTYHAVLSTKQPLELLVAEQMPADADPLRDIVFITRGGALFPFYRTSSLLEQLKGKVHVPSVLFYPGELDGAAGLRFMGVLDAEHNYRPKIF
jgi:hypothetical protein